MKNNHINHGPNRGVLISAISVIITILIIALAIGYNKLSDIYHQQCVITDMAKQVIVVSPGKLAKADAIAESFGLRPGVNLSEINFAEKREEILSKYHMLRSISVARQLPDKVTITVEERVPIARLGIHNSKKRTDLVVDADCVAFDCSRGTSRLPIIYEPPEKRLFSGQRATGRTYSAIKLIEMAKDARFSALGIQDVDTYKPDFLLLTLEDYSIVKIAWEGMEEWSEISRMNLETQLNCLATTILSRVAPNCRLWNATIPNQVFANTQEENIKP